MRRIFKVHKDAKTIYLTKDLVAEGFDGELEGFANACTFVLVKPRTTLDQAIESLETTIRDLRLRKKLNQSIESKPPEQPKTEVELEFDAMRRRLKGEK